VSNNGKRRPEIMAPAGSLEAAQVAFDAGADVVYAGVTNISMRPKRVEFGRDSIGELLEYAHERGKKVYAVANVCPKPADIPLFEEKIAELYEKKADGIIMSDISMMEYVHANYPDLPIHASIMTSVVNAEAAKFYKDRGASVVVVSRSLKNMEQVRRIREETDIDIEVFVHGGICYMFDGDCYMSSYWRQKWDYDPDLGTHRLFGQNNTKGECQLICKRQCSLTGDEGELASGRLMRRADDVGIERIPFYVDIGVKILKIEGRAMPLRYIREATALYRQALDSYMEDPERFSFTDEWRQVVDRLIEDRFEYERTWHIG
jgi:putative protease